MVSLLAALWLIQHGKVVAGYQDWCQRSVEGPAYAECMLDTPTIRESREGDYVVDLTYFVGNTSLKMVYSYDHVPYLVRSYPDVP